MGQQQPGSPVPSDVLLQELLDELGYGGRNEATARQALEAAGLTRPGKQRIATRKRPEVARLLRERFFLLCTRTPCQEAAAGSGRAPLVAERPTECELCSGSGNRHAVDRLCAAFVASGIRRVVIVGGSPSARETMLALVASRVQLRLVDGVSRRTKTEARADLQWADQIIIWGGTQLDHKVSCLYTTAGDAKVVAVHRRGVAALCDELLPALLRR